MGDCCGKSTNILKFYKHETSINSYRNASKFAYIPMDSQTTDITQFAVDFRYDVTIKALETLQTQLITVDVIMKSNSKVHDVHSLACKIKVLNGRELEN